MFDVPDIEYATALEVTAGGRMFNVVVDDETTAKKLLERGQLTNRVTFIPLNKIQGRKMDARTVATAQKIAGKDNCHPAISLIGFEGELEPAMNYIFGNSFVCSDLSIARKVTYNEQVACKTVTLDGDVVDPAGTLTGGSRPAGGSFLAKLSELKQHRNNYEASEQQLTEVELELRNKERSVNQYRVAKERYDVKRHEFELLQQRLQQTLHHRQL